MALWFACLCVLLPVAPAMADPAGRVGRLAWVSGAVHLHRADSGETLPASLNWPLTSGDTLTTSPGARAEVQIGSTMLHLDANSALELTRIDDERVRLHLLDGSLMARLRLPEAAREFELETREGRFSPLTIGSYRVDVDRLSAAATVYAGRLRFKAVDSVVDIDAEQRAQFWSPGHTQHRFLPASKDDFARWALARDRQDDGSQVLRYVSPEMTGSGDLDANGRWYESPEYGPVWFPTVSDDWVPYRSGRWTWVAPWGWTWVGDEPWGFAPFHYGRWVYLRDAWGWVPGRKVARPVYAPALVAWVGARQAARPAVGWFPLAPNEVYVPSYGGGERYLRALNSPYVASNVDFKRYASNPQLAESARYTHFGQSRAITMVAPDALTQRRHIGEALISERDRPPTSTQPAVRFQAPVAGPRYEKQPVRGRQDDFKAQQSAAPEEGRGTPMIKPTTRPLYEPSPERIRPATAPRSERIEQPPSPAPMAVPPRSERPSAEIFRANPAPSAERERSAPRPQAATIFSPRSERPVAEPQPSPPRADRSDERSEHRRPEHVFPREVPANAASVRSEPRVERAPPPAPQATVAPSPRFERPGRADTPSDARGAAKERERERDRPGREERRPFDRP
jgi:hypothetical protein